MPITKKLLYSYDRYGKIKSVKDGAEIGNVRTEYEFDDYNNISKEYEIIGAKIEKKSYYYDNANRLLLEDSNNRTVQYEYDNSVNLIMKITGIDSNAETAYYRYDGYNRLSEFIDDYSAAEYEYNINGLRESKTVNGTKTRYIYNGADIVGEMFDDNIYTYDDVLNIISKKIRKVAQSKVKTNLNDADVEISTQIAKFAETGITIDPKDITVTNDVVCIKIYSIGIFNDIDKVLNEFDFLKKKIQMTNIF